MSEPTLPGELVMELPTGGEVIVVPSPGPPGADGANTDTRATLVAGETLSGHRVVTRAPDGTAVYADNTDPDHASAPLWLTVGAALAGDPVTVQVVGIVDEPSWSWTPDAPLFLGMNGVLTQTVPTTGAGALFLVQVAYATSATSVMVDRQPSIVLSDGTSSPAPDPVVTPASADHEALVQEVVDRQVADGRLQVAIDRRYRFNPAVGIPERDLSDGVIAKLNPPLAGSGSGTVGRGSLSDRHLASDAGIAEHKLALASDAHPAVASRRTLGLGPRQAMPGNSPLLVSGVDVPPLVSGLVPASFLPSGSVAGAPLDTASLPQPPGIPTPGVSVRSSPADHVHGRPAASAAGDHGLLAWSYDPALALTGGVGVLGTLQMVRIWIPNPMTITGIILNAFTGGGGLANAFTALFDANKNLLGQSSNRATTWGSTTGDKKGDLASPVSITTPGYVFAGWWVTGTTSPAWARLANAGSHFNVNLSGNSLRFSTANTALTTTAPSTAATLVAATSSFFVGLY